MPINQRAERFAAALGFPGGNRDGRAVAQPNVAVNIRRSERFFKPADVVLRKGVGAAEGRAGIPYTAGINQQHGVTADTFTSATNEFDVQRFALPHRFPPKLHRAVTAVDPPLRNGSGLFSGASEEA